MSAAAIWAGTGSLAPGDRNGGAASSAASTARTPASLPSLTPAPLSVSRVSGPTRVIITAGGVVLPVIATEPSGWIVSTPCGRSAALAASPALDLVDRADVVLDPGHGGATEGGAVGANGLAEADVNLAVARLAAAKLEAAGYRAILTRRGDYRLPIVGRVAIADALAAPLVSIHHNGGAANPSTMPGTEVIYPQDDLRSRRLAGLIWEESMARLSRFTADWVAGGDAGATYRLGPTGDDYFGIVRLPASAAVLAEMIYIGNPSEAELLATSDFLNAEAEAIAAAVRRWLETADPGAGFVEPSYRLTAPGGGGGSVNCVDPPLE